MSRVEEVVVVCGGAKIGPSWERAMKRVNAVLWARVSIWKGRRGGCGVRDSRGSISLARRGGSYGRVIVWYSRIKRAVKMR